MNTVVTMKQIREEVDKSSSGFTAGRERMNLFGGCKSQFLDSLGRKAKSFGIEVCRYTRPPEWCDYGPYVVDTETCCYDPRKLEGEVDLDTAAGLTAVSEAVLAFLGRNNLIKGKNITIIGRGHSVKGLFQTLLANDATVTVAHSKTKELWKVIESAHVVIVATPVVDRGMWAANGIVVDLSGAGDAAKVLHDRCEYIGPGAVGALTTSILVNRYMETYGRRVE